MNPLPGVTAQDVTEDRGGRNILRLPIAARGVCIGRAMSRVEGSEGAFWNPAGLAGVTRNQGCADSVV